MGDTDMLRHCEECGGRTHNYVEMTANRDALEHGVRNGRRDRSVHRPVTAPSAGVVSSGGRTGHATRVSRGELGEVVEQALCLAGGARSSPL